MCASVCVCVCVCVCRGGFLCASVCVCVCVCVCANFWAKETALTFLAQDFPKMDLWLEIQKANIGITISIPEIVYMPIFRPSNQV